MAQNIYARTASRGFPVQDVSGQTGVGHLQDKTRLPDVAGLPEPGQPYPQNDPANTPALLAPPEEYILGYSLWGLPAGRNPDTTPHGVEYETKLMGDIGPGGPPAGLISHGQLNDPYPQGPYHDAPLIDPGLATLSATLPAAYLEADAVRNPKIDSSEEVLYPNYVDVDYVGFQGVMKQDHVGPVEGNSDTVQEKVTGSLRGNMGFDAVQGYGGGGKGPGGTNLPQLTEDHRDYPGSFYSHDAFTSAAEVPHIDAVAAQFIQNQPGMAPWTGDMWSAPLTQTHAQDILPADLPLQGQPVAASSGGLLPPVWGA